MEFSAKTKLDESQLSLSKDVQHKRAYVRPKLSSFGSVASVTGSGKTTSFFDPMSCTFKGAKSSVMYDPNCKPK